MIRALALAVALSFAAPAVASDFLVKCVSGCPQTLKAGALKADPPLPTDIWWVGPSLGLSLFARDSQTKTWESGVVLAFNYGIFWRPTWSPTSSFLSLNMGLAAGNISAFTGVSTFDITIPFTIGFMDIIAVGIGPRFKMATTPAMQDSVSLVTFVGLATSFGGP
jgi:hypothetical protein